MYQNLSQFITKLNFAKLRRSQYTFVKNTKINREILSILVTLGNIRSFRIISTGQIKVWLKWDKGFCAFSRLKQGSKPSKIQNSTVKKLYRTGRNSSEAAVSIISTSRGLQTVHESFKQHSGGEVLLKVYNLT